MKGFIVSMVVALIALVAAPAQANDGKVGPIEYASAAQGWTKTHVEQVWDGNGTRTDHWYTTNHEYIQKRYPSTENNQWVVANYVAAGANLNPDGTLTPIWDLSQKFWCSTDKCTPAF